MKKIFVSFAILTLGVFANASTDHFAGEWKGQGVYILDGDMTHCSTFEMTFKVEGDVFEFTKGRRNCEKHDETFERVQMKMKDGQLLLGSMVVGRYDGQTLESAFRAPDGNSFRNWRMLMRVQGNHIMYEESRRMDGEVTPLISFAGLLIRQ